jgi:hypothetical protein
MSAWDALQSLHTTDPRDAGCAETFELIQAYAEIAATGGDPEVFVSQAESDPESETSEGLQHLSRLVYRRCEAMAADAALARTMTTPPLMV